MVEYGTWYPYTGNSAFLLAFMLFVAVILLVYAGKRQRRPITVKRPGRTVSGFLIILWFLSIYIFNIALYTYAMQLSEAKLFGTSPVNNITPVTLVSAVATFLIILYLTKKHGWKIAFGSALIGTTAGPMVFEFPFDIIVMNKIYPAVPSNPLLYRELFFLPWFLIEIITFSLLTLSPAMKVSKYTLFSLAGMLFVFALWALFGFAYGATGTNPLLYTFNAVSKVLGFTAIITLFTNAREPVKDK